MKSHNDSVSEANLILFIPRFRYVFHRGKRSRACERRSGSSAVMCSSSTFPRLIQYLIYNIFIQFYSQLYMYDDVNESWYLELHFLLRLDDLTFRWMLNEFPIFIPMDKRRFVSQITGNLYIAKVEASDSGNYSCFVSSISIAKSVFSKFIPLVPQTERMPLFPFFLKLQNVTVP